MFRLHCANVGPAPAYEFSHRTGWHDQIHGEGKIDHVAAHARHILHVFVPARRDLDTAPVDLVRRGA